MKMKMYHIEDPEKFLESVNQCKGNVELVSEQGDHLNLKSELTKYIAISKLFSDNTFINQMELVASDPDDIKFLLQYMMEDK